MDEPSSPDPGVWPGPQRRPHSPSARGGWGLVATRTSRSSHRPPSPRTQGPWGRTRFRVLYAGGHGTRPRRSRTCGDHETDKPGGSSPRPGCNPAPFRTPTSRLPARPTPVGVTEGSRGSSAATTPGPRPPSTPAPRRRCQKAWSNLSSVDDAHRLAHRPSSACVSVRVPNNPGSGEWLRVVSGN